MTKLNNFNQYVLKKCLIGDGMINGIINAIIFYFLEKGHIGTKTFAVGDIVKDLAFTSLILGWILASIVLPLTLKDVKKGKISAQEGTNKIANIMPNKKGLAYIVVGLLTMVVTVSITWLVATIIPTPLTVMQMMVFKGVMCAIAGASSAYMTIITTVYKFAK